MSYTKHPVANTCPLIDSVISELKDIQENTDTAFYSLEDLKNLVEDSSDVLPHNALDEILDKIAFIKEHLSNITNKSLYKGINNTLEDIRSANSSLRDWGQTNGEVCETLEHQLDDSFNKISSLESIISDYNLKSPF